MNRRLFLVAVTLISAFFGLALPLAAQGNASYRIRAHYKLEGAGAVGGLWLDAGSRSLYVAQGDHIEVLNADTGRREGSMPAQGAAGVIVAEGTGHGFFANGAGNSVAMFDSASLSIQKTIPLGVKGPQSLVFDSDAGRVFVVAPAAGSVVALNAQTGEVVGKVALKGNLGQAVTNGMGSLFVAAEDLNAIHVVDTHTMKFLGDFPSGDARGPVSLAIDPSGRRLFVACTDGQLAVIDTDIGFTFEELPIGTGDPGSAFTFTPQGKGGWKGADFVASANGTLTLVRMNAFIRYSVGGSISIPTNIHAVAYDPKTHWIFLPQSTPTAEVLVMAPEFAEVAQ